MANNKSSTPGSTNAPGAAANSSTPIGGSSPAGGSPSSANAIGIGPTTVIKPPKGFQQTVQQILAGAVKDIPAAGSVPSVGQQITLAQIEGTLQPVLDAFTAVSEAQAEAKKSIANAKLALTALLPEAHAFVDQLKVALIAFFGKGSPILVDFGIKDRSNPKKPTVDAKAAAKVKANETRQLRSPLTKAEKAALQFQGQVAPASAVKPASGSSNPNPGANDPGNGQ